MDQKTEGSIGEAMYVESLMTKDEWVERMGKYPTSIKFYGYAHRDKPNKFKWRYRMGQGLTTEEINLINNRLDAVLKKAGKL